MRPGRAVELAKGGRRLGIRPCASRVTRCYSGDSLIPQEAIAYGVPSIRFRTRICRCLLEECILYRLGSQGYLCAPMRELHLPLAISSRSVHGVNIRLRLVFRWVPPVWLSPMSVSCCCFVVFLTRSSSRLISNSEIMIAHLRRMDGQDSLNSGFSALAGWRVKVLSSVCTNFRL